MLVKFAVTNYRGFKDRIEFILSEPRNYDFSRFAVKNGIIKNGIIYGPNGSGKSNFGLAMFDIVNHLTQKWRDTNYYNNFIFAGIENSSVLFEYVFLFAGKKLEYIYEKNKNGNLIKEKLIFDNKEVFSIDTDTFTLSSEFPIESFAKENLISMANNISIINYLLTSFPLPESHYLLLLQNFVNSMLWFKCLEERRFIGLESDSFYINKYIIENNLITDFQNFLQEVSHQEFKLTTRNEDDTFLYCYINNRLVQFNKIISTGTSALMLLYFWINRMKRASFVFIDEFDAFYHFNLSYQVCKRLFALDCQIFLSSHNTYLMSNDLLRPDCNFILDKNHIKPLCDCTEKDLRFGHNMEKLFRGGTFSV